MINDYRNTLRDVEKIREFMNNIDEFYNSKKTKAVWDKVEQYFHMLFEQIAPFKLNDKVVLIKTPKIDENTRWGWMGSKHFLLEGEKATVCSVDIDKGKWLLGLVFENDSWISHTTNEAILRKSNKRGVYYFTSDFVAHLEEK